MKLSLTCEHGTRTVEFDEGREGIGNVQSLSGQTSSFACRLVAEVMPRCPYCDFLPLPAGPTSPTTSPSPSHEGGGLSSFQDRQHDLTADLRRGFLDTEDEG